MIGVLFGINVLIALIIIFATTMLQNHFKKLEKSIMIYHNPKVYKTGSDIAFIRDLMEKYEKAYELGECKKVDLPSMIQASFYEKKVGKFPYYQVQSIALKGKWVMWFVFSIQVLLGVLSSDTQHMTLNSIFVVASGLIGFIITLLGVFKGIPEQREQLFIKLQDYIMNAYPTEMKYLEKQKDVKVLLDKIEKLEGELEEYRQANMPIEAEKSLREEDIKKVLNQIDINL